MGATVELTRSVETRLGLLPVGVVGSLIYAAETRRGDGRLWDLVSFNRELVAVPHDALRIVPFDEVVLVRCTRTGGPPDAIETCDAPALVCIDDRGDHKAFCLECAWRMLNVTERPFPMPSAFGMAPGEATEIYGR